MSGNVIKIAPDPGPPGEDSVARRGEPRSGGLPVGWIVLGLGLLAMAGWIGLRVRTALRKQGELATERNQAAQAAVAQGKAGLRGRAVRGAPERWRPNVPLDGTLQPREEADLGFKAGGRLAGIRVRLGDRVGRGQVLATLDATEATAQLQAVDAQIKAAEAQLGLAEDAEQRTTTLVGSGAAPQASGIQVSGQRSLAAAQLEAARAQRALAAAAVANHTLAAPFPGVVTKVPSGVGAVIGPGATLFHVQDTTNLKLVGTVSEPDAALVRAGAAVELLGETQVDAAGKPITGKVRAVLGTVDPGTRRVPVEAEVPNPPGGRLLAGSFTRAVIRGVEEVAVLRLPAAALRHGAQDEVMVVQGGRLAARRVAFSLAPDGALLVRHGLDAQDQVLLSAPPEAKDGDAVEIIDAGAGARP